MVQNKKIPDSAQPGPEKQILIAAKEVFLEKGFDGARMQEIADKAGLNKALLHYYYRSKEKLYRVIVKDIMDQFFPVVFGVFDETGSLSDKITRFFDLYIGFLLDNPLVPQFIIAEIVRKPEMLMEFFSGPMESGVILQLSELIDECVRKGEMRPIPTEEFLMNLISLSVFPIIAKPILMNFLEKDDKEYNELINKRKRVTADFFIRAIK